MKSSKATWLDRFLIVGPYLALCTTEDEYNAACTHLKVPANQRGVWLQSGGTTHTFEQNGKALTCIVCVDLKEIKKRPICEVANILVHEAVHVFQQHCKDINESKPSDEFEAYSIQSIFTTLFTEALKRRAP